MSIWPPWKLVWASPPLLKIDANSSSITIGKITVKTTARGLRRMLFNE